MARLFTCGFEENNLTATMWTGTDNNAPSVGTTAPHSGTYRLDTASAAGTSGVNRSLSAGKTSGTVWVRFYFRASDATPSADTNIFISRNVGVSATGGVINLLTSGVLRLNNAISATNTDGATVLANDTWYRIEFRHLIAESPSGELEMRLYLGDSTTALDTLTITGEDTRPTDIGNFRFAKGTTGPAGVTFSYDDIAINDDSGTFQNSWCGPGKIAMLVPNTEVTIGFTPLSGTDNSDMVNDLPGAPDDDTSYNTTATDATVDRLGLTALPAEVTADATITLADVYGRMRGDGTTGTRTARVKIWDEGGTLTNGPDSNLIDNTAYRIFTTAEHLVLDTAGKTKANLADFDAGYEETASNDNMFVTALWVNVEWLEAAAASTARHGPLLGFKRNRLVNPLAA